MIAAPSSRVVRRCGKPVALKGETRITSRHKAKPWRAAPYWRRQHRVASTMCASARSINIAQHRPCVQVFTSRGINHVFQFSGCKHRSDHVCKCRSRVEPACPKAAPLGRRETTTANLISTLITSASKIQQKNPYATARRTSVSIAVVLHSPEHFHRQYMCICESHVFLGLAIFCPSSRGPRQGMFQPAIFWKFGNVVVW